MGNHEGIAVEGRPVDMVRYGYHIQVALDWLSVLFSNQNYFSGILRTLYV